MEVNIMRDKINGTWTIDYRGTVTTHNHPPSTDQSSRPVIQRASMTFEMKATIAVDAATVVAARQTMAWILDVI